MTTSITRRLFLPAIAVALCLTLPAWGDTLHLKDGRQISGKLVDANSSKVKFKADGGSTVTYSRSDVSSIALDDAAGASTALSTGSAADATSTTTSSETSSTRITNQAEPIPSDAASASVTTTTPSQSAATAPSAQTSSAITTTTAQASTMASGSLTIPADTKLVVRMSDTINSETMQAGNRWRGVLEQDLSVNGQLVAAKGTEVSGFLVETSTPAASGKKELTLELTEMNISGSPVSITRSSETQVAGGVSTTLGQGAVIGSVVGGVSGGAPGVGVGAGVGAGASGAQVMVRGESVRIPGDTVVEFRLQQPWNYSGSGAAAGGASGTTPATPSTASPSSTTPDSTKPQSSPTPDAMTPQSSTMPGNTSQTPGTAGTPSNTVTPNKPDPTTGTPNVGSDARTTSDAAVDQSTPGNRSRSSEAPGTRRDESMGAAGTTTDRTGTSTTGKKAPKKKRGTRSNTTPAAPNTESQSSTSPKP